MQWCTTPVYTSVFFTDKMIVLLIIILILILILISIIILLPKLFVKLTTGRCKSNVCLIGKTVLIIGGNSGLGLQTGLALAGRGCRLIIADCENCEASKSEIIRKTGNSNIIIKRVDLASFNSIRKLAKDINKTESRLDVLINNAAISSSGNDHTEDGLNKCMQVNHYGSFLLTHLLIGLLKKSAPSRIIFVSSIAAYLVNLNESDLHRPKSEWHIFSDHFYYAKSKLCSVITAKVFAQKLKGTGVICNSVHPGLVKTTLLKKFSYGLQSNKLHENIIYFILYNVIGLFSIDMDEGAQTMIHMALAKEDEKVTGEYYINCKPFFSPPLIKNAGLVEKIWKASEEYVKLTPEEKL